MKTKLTLLFFTIILSFASFQVYSQATVAREWNEAMLQSIRKDLARPPVQARNLFHISAAGYDAWAVFDDEAETYFLGHTINGFNIPFNGFTPGPDIEAQRKEAISFAMYRMLLHRYKFSPEGVAARDRYNALMDLLGYDRTITSIDYSTGSPAALGNYIANRIIAFGLQDGSRELQNYSNSYYAPVNPPLVTVNPGNPTLVNPNRWQSLTLGLFIDQNGNTIPGSTPNFLGAQWGNVIPYSFTNADKTVNIRNGNNFNVYLDPGPMVLIDTTSVVNSEDYKWNFGLVAQWSAHLDPTDGVIIDISPNSIGNTGSLPTVDMYDTFYDYMNGGDASLGHAVNPKTGLPYAPQIVPRGDYTRVLSEFWADGPVSETPPGHWYSILNKVNDDPQLIKKYGGKGDVVDDLEWDIKSYFILGGAMHDAAICAWGIKGWYDGIRPISALRFMADKGQCTDPLLPHYHPAGMNLIPGFVELVLAGDPLVGNSNQHLNKIKIKAWRGRTFIANPAADIAGVDWIRAEDWVPYQLPTFVTPPFAGYISGHSTYSRSAAEVLTAFTGDEFFPGGMGEFHFTNHNFLKFESGPSIDMSLQWATYRDASDQTSLSRIWGGIHPPFDDIPGRKNGIIIGKKVFDKTTDIFYNDEDGDGFFSYEDCDDTNEEVYVGAVDVCDGLDNDCDGVVDGSTDQDNDLIGDECDNDDDGDNVMDAYDSCHNTIPGATVNSFGCTDEDGDEFYPDVNPPSMNFDPDDDNPCLPNTMADQCDADQDGLTNFQERLGPDNQPNTGDESNPLDICDPNPIFAVCGSRIAGITWEDKNYDGQYQIGEPLLGGVIVKLYKYDMNTGSILITFTYSEPNGTYNFPIVPDGTYFLVFVLPDDHGQTKKKVGNPLTDSDVTNAIKDGSTDLLILDRMTDFGNIYAGFYQCNKVGDLVWYDVDKDDIADPTENGLNGLRVELYRNENGSYVLFDWQFSGHKPNTPSDDGYFEFCAPQGQYYIRVIMPPMGLVLVRPNIGSNEQVDSDITNAFGTGTSSSFAITNGIDKMDLGAGYYPKATAGNRVWVDTNVDGIQSPEELGLANVLVEAYNADNEFVEQTVTDQNGIYQLDYLQKQAYYIRFSPPSGYGITPSLPEQDEINSDIDHSNGLNTTRLISFQPGENNVNIDAGVVYSVLPVSWEKIYGYEKGHQNVVEWSVANEFQVQSYEVERSVNDHLLFEHISTIKPSSDNVYIFYDENFTDATNFYRIKAVDLNGNKSYSEIVVIRRVSNLPDNLRIQPNPTNQYSTISVESISSTAVLSIYRTTGELMYNTLIYPDKKNSFHYDFQADSPGIYYVELKHENKVQMKKLIVIE